MWNQPKSALRFYSGGSIEKALRIAGKPSLLDSTFDPQVVKTIERDRAKTVIRKDGMAVV